MQNADFLLSLAEHPQFFRVFKNYHPRSCRFPKRAFSAVSAASVIVFQCFTFSPERQLSPVRRDPFCFPKSAFIAPVLPSLNSFQIPFFSACSAFFLLVFEIIAFLPCLFSFSKIPLFCFAPVVFQIITFLHFVFQNSSLPRRSCYRFGKLPFIAPRSSGRFSFGKLEISASLAAGKTGFRIFGKLKQITRRASAIFRDIGKLSFWFASLEDLQAPIIINILI